MGEDMLIPIIAAVLGFVSVLAVVFGLSGLFSDAGKVERMRAKVHGGHAPDSGFTDVVRQLAGKFAHIFSNLGTKVAPKEEDRVSDGQLKLVQAGIRSNDAYRVFQGSKAFLALILGGTALVVRQLVFDDASLSSSIFMIVGAATAGVYAPDLWLRSKLSKRNTAITNALPDALDLLVVCVESGMGLDQAIARVCEEMRLSGPELSEEFYLLTLELRAGKKRSEALRSLSQRVGVDDLNSLVTLLIQADIFGISVGRTLRVYSDSMRKKRQQRAEEAAAKLPAKLMLPLILFILPALFMTIMGPAVIMLGNVFTSMPK